MIFLLFASAAFMALCPRLSQLRAKKGSSNQKHGSSRATPSPEGSPAPVFGAIHVFFGAVSPYPFLGAIQPIFFWCGLSSPYPFFGAIQPIFFWSYPAHILLVFPAYILLVLSSPYPFLGCPAHILSLELSSPYPFLGAVQPISFLWRSPAHIFSFESSSPKCSGLPSPYPISFLWRYPAHIFSSGSSSPKCWGLSRPYPFGLLLVCPAHFPTAYLWEGSTQACNPAPAIIFLHSVVLSS